MILAWIKDPLSPGLAIRRGNMLFAIKMLWSLMASARSPIYSLRRLPRCSLRGTLVPSYNTISAGFVTPLLFLGLMNRV